MVHIKSETETVIKKILPYLNRRGYDTVKDFDFETMSTLTDSYSKGFVDILVTLGKKNAAFLIEAKRISKKLTNKDRDQAISYGCTGDDLETEKVALPYGENGQLQRLFAAVESQR